MAGAALFSKTLPGYTVLSYPCRPQLTGVDLAVSGIQMYRQTESVLARVGQQLSQLERRDWELWVIVSLTGVLVATGLLAILFPAAFLKQENVHFEVRKSGHR